MADNTYAVKCQCTNCGFHGDVQIAKGTLKPEKAECPTCGNITAIPTPLVRPPVKRGREQEPYVRPWTTNPFDEPWKIVKEPDREPWKNPPYKIWYEMEQTDKNGFIQGFNLGLDNKTRVIN